MNTTKPTPEPPAAWPPRRTRMGRAFEWLIEQRVIVLILLGVLTVAGLIASPFDSGLSLPRHPVAVDAIPDIGENQQIVHIAWPGRSAQDIEDQIAYPLSSILTSVPGVTTIRSQAMLGSASIYIIFDEKTEYYWSRSRIQETLSNLDTDQIPTGASLTLGPPASALGQVYWYTLEGRDAKGNPAGGWDLHELRRIQDYQVRYALREVEGVAEVASIGGHVPALTVEPNLQELEARGLSIQDLWSALRQVSAEVGASSTEMNGVEYIIRSEGFVRDTDAVRHALVQRQDGVSVRVEEVAHVSFQPQDRDGILDKDGAEAVGGIVIARHGGNPMEVTRRVHAALDNLQASLPSKTLPDGRVSQVEVVPYLDRSTLISATLDTLQESLSHAVAITIVVVLLMLAHLRTASLVALLLPLAVLWTFVAMRAFGVTANVVSLAGIAIAIGTMIDLGIVMSENIVRRLDDGDPELPRRVAIAEASSEVSGAMLTALATTALSFLPVFLLEGAEGKLFQPLAFTKTWALLFSFIVSIFVIPVAAYILFDPRLRSRAAVLVVQGLTVVVAVVSITQGHFFFALLLIVSAGFQLLSEFGVVWRGLGAARWHQFSIWSLSLAAITLLSAMWSPGGSELSVVKNRLLVGGIVIATILFFRLFSAIYPRILRFSLQHKALALMPAVVVVFLGALMWQGVPKLREAMPSWLAESAPVTALSKQLPGIQSEFMPALNEGAFLYMPTTAPHASVGEILRLSSLLTRRFEAIPEVESAVTKAGRADTALDPAPLSMLETVITYHSEFIEDERGRKLRFAVDRDGEFLRDDAGELIPDPHGRAFRQWRPKIKTSNDIWDEVVHAGDIPGLTGAPILQPISARVVMLQSGIRAATALRIRGATLEELYKSAEELEAFVREQPLVARESVVADRSAGRPYIVIHPDRRALAEYGVTIQSFQDAVEVGVGGGNAGVYYEGRARYPIALRLAREDRNDIEALKRMPVMTLDGATVPLSRVANIEIEMGPVMISTENSSLVTWVMFSPRRGVSEMQIVDALQAALDEARADGTLKHQDGLRLDFVGSYESSVRATARLKLLLPIVLLIVFMLLKLQLRDTIVTAMVFSAVAVSAAGGMIWLWFYGQPWFLDFSLFGVNLQEALQVRATYLSVAVWVGFIALAGIATDDGVLMATWLQQRFREQPPQSVEELHSHVLDVGQRRLRPCLMTTATTLLALLPVLTSQGTGSDVMIPMAIPIFGGMLFALLTLFVVPLFYTAWRERNLRRQLSL